MILNTHQQIDLEMQVNDYHDWPERSIGYLCRMYDSLEHGEEYIDTKPAIHIGILDYTPFPEQPLFYSKNQIMDVNTHVKNEYLTETSNTLCDLYADRNVKERCLDRIEYNLRMKRYENLEKTLEEKDKELAEKDATIEKLMEEIKKLKQQ